MMLSPITRPIGISSDVHVGVPDVMLMVQAVRLAAVPFWPR